jgi:hypothetical protein
MPARRRGALALVAAAAALAGCGSGDGGGEGGSSASPSTVQEGQVAAVAVAAGDCLNGIVIGRGERREIDSARVVSCDGPHALEVFATFTLTAADLDVEDATGYPGKVRVVRAADEGCSARIEAVVEEPDAYGLMALWPSESSWATGDRAVACAVFSPDGAAFDEREL